MQNNCRDSDSFCLQRDKAHLRMRLCFTEIQQEAYRMRKKLKAALTILLSCALTCILTIRVVTGQNPFTVLAGGGDNWVYSVNNQSPDANGNVDVAKVNGKTVNSDIPASANFAQYGQNWICYGC